MLLNVGRTVARFNNQTVALLLPAGGGYDSRGNFLAVSDVLLTDVRANVQPNAGRVARQDAGGERVDDQVTVWFTFLVDTANEALQNRAAKLIYDGRIWKCLRTRPWVKNGFTECVFEDTKEVYSP